MLYSMCLTGCGRPTVYPDMLYITVLTGTILSGVFTCTRVIHSNNSNQIVTHTYTYLTILV